MLGPGFIDFSSLSSSLRWHRGGGFAVVYGFWLGSVVKDWGFVVGQLWRFLSFGLDRWFWVYCGVVGGGWSHIYGFMGFDDANKVVLLMGLWLLLMVDGYGFLGFA
nr:hypothetical protein CFP56_18864 [Quercus suber]